MTNSFFFFFFTFRPFLLSQKKLHAQKQSAPTFTSQQPLAVVALVQLCLILCDPMNYSMPGFSPSFTVSLSLLKLMSIETVMPSNHLILCHPLFLLPSIFSTIKIISNELALQIRWQSLGASASVLPANIQC